MKVAYYPGCATHGFARDIDVATKKVAEVLGLELVEVEDWNCCGGGFLDEKDEVAFVSINLRNLSTVERMGMKKMVTPCSVCLHSARKSEVVYKEDKYLRREVDSRLRGTQVSYKGEATAEHLVWVLLRDVGLERLKAQVKKPLKGLRVGAYYGCQMLRPQKYLGFEEPSRPKSMEQLIAVTGATPVTFSQATSCCGFPLLGSNEYMGLKLAYKVLEGAKHAGADLMAHPCSLCHLQLDMTQEKVRYTFKLQWRLPALYIAQLIGLSFGFSPDELQVPKGVTEVLESKGLA